MDGCIACSSIGIGNTPALIFPRGPKRLKERRRPRSVTSPPSSAWTGPACRYSTSAAAGGGMALTLARDYGATVTGITLSTEQLAEAQARAKAEAMHGPKPRE